MKKTLLALLALLTLACSASAAFQPTIEIRIPPTVPGQIQFWAQVPLDEAWIFEISSNFVLWVQAGNQTTVNDGWTFYETSTLSQTHEFVRMRLLGPAPRHECDKINLIFQRAGRYYHHEWNKPSS